MVCGCILGNVGAWRGSLFATNSTNIWPIGGSATPILIATNCQHNMLQLHHLISLQNKLTSEMWEHCRSDNRGPRSFWHGKLNSFHSTWPRRDKSERISFYQHSSWFLSPKQVWFFTVGRVKVSITALENFVKRGFPKCSFEWEEGGLKSYSANIQCPSRVFVWIWWGFPQISLFSFLGQILTIICKCLVLCWQNIFNSITSGIMLIVIFLF